MSSFSVSLPPGPAGHWYPGGSNGSYQYVFFCFGFIIGWVLCQTALEVVHSGVSSFFVCFAEDPAALCDSQPDLYAEVVEAWTGRFPNENHHFRSIAMTQKGSFSYPRRGQHGNERV